MKKKLLLLSLLIFTPVLNAYFFAYQKWVNPKTGQVLEEYYDVHEDNPEHSDSKQQEDFVTDAKKYDDDGPILEEFYTSIRMGSYKDIYAAIVSANPFGALFNGLFIYGWLLCDTLALHEIQTTKKKRIKLAAGAAHIRNINHYLSKLG